MNLSLNDQQNSKSSSTLYHFSGSCGVNIPIVADFKLPMWCYWMRSWKEMHTILWYFHHTDILDITSGIWRICVCACMQSHFGCVWLFETPWTVAHQAPLSMAFSRQVPCSRGSSQPKDQTSIPDVSCIGRQFFTTSATWKAQALILPPGKHC